MNHKDMDIINIFNILYYRVQFCYLYAILLYYTYYAYFNSTSCILVDKMPNHYLPSVMCNFSSMQCYITPP